MQSITQLDNLNMFFDFIESKSKNDKSFHEISVITQEMLASIENSDFNEYNVILKMLQPVYEGLTEKNKLIINNFTETSFSTTFF